MTPEDADGFAALVRAAFATLAVEPAPSALRVTGDDVRAHLATGGGIVAGAMQAGLLWAEQEGGLHLSRVSVHPAHRRQGLARALLDAAAAEARRRGLPRLVLSTRIAATGNRRLFTGCGFIEGATRSHPGLTVPTIVEMTRWLGEPGPPARVMTQR